MANKRGDGLVNVALWIEDEILAAVESARTGEGENRSAFIREAIAERLTRLGINYNKAKVAARDRVRRPVKLYDQPHIQESATLNDKTASDAEILKLSGKGAVEPPPGDAAGGLKYELQNERRRRKRKTPPKPPKGD